MRCPHCHRSIGSLSKSGEHRIRLSIILVDPETERIHGPCTRCGGDVTLAEGARLAKSLSDGPTEIRPGIRLTG